MRNETRVHYNGYLGQIAALNGVVDPTVKFTATPSVQQKLESRIQESSAFLTSINIMPVDEQEGEKLGLGVTGTIAGRTDTTTKDREAFDPTDQTDQKYRCEQTNYDTALRYSRIDAWAKFPDFQTRIRDAILKRQALDRIMIGFNGTSVAKDTNRATSPLLQDVNIGWLEKMRLNAAERVMKEVVALSGKINVGAGGDYENIDALVFDMVNSLLDPWFQDDTELVVLCGRKLLSDKYFPLVNQAAPASEQIAADLIISQKRIGNLPAIRVPSFPPDALMVTRLDNLSIYWQEGTRRRSLVDNAKRDQIENYESSNDAYVVEDYGCAALAENITLV